MSFSVNPYGSGLGHSGHSFGAPLAKTNMFDSYKLGTSPFAGGDSMQNVFGNSFSMGPTTPAGHPVAMTHVSPEQMGPKVVTTWSESLERESLVFSRVILQKILEEDDYPLSLALPVALSQTINITWHKYFMNERRMIPVPELAPSPMMSYSVSGRMDSLTRYGQGFVMELSFSDSTQGYYQLGYYTHQITTNLRITMSYDVHMALITSVHLHALNSVEALTGVHQYKKAETVFDLLDGGRDFGVFSNRDGFESSMNRYRKIFQRNAQVYPNLCIMSEGTSHFIAFRPTRTEHNISGRLAEDHITKGPQLYDTYEGMILKQSRSYAVAKGIEPVDPHVWRSIIGTFASAVDRTSADETYDTSLRTVKVYDQDADNDVEITIQEMIKACRVFRNPFRNDSDNRMDDDDMGLKPLYPPIDTYEPHVYDFVNSINKSGIHQGQGSTKTRGFDTIIGTKLNSQAVLSDLNIPFIFHNGQKLAVAHYFGQMERRCLDSTNEMRHVEVAVHKIEKRVPNFSTRYNNTINFLEENASIDDPADPLFGCASYLALKEIAKGVKKPLKDDDDKPLGDFFFTSWRSEDEMTDNPINEQDVQRAKEACSLIKDFEKVLRAFYPHCEAFEVRQLDPVALSLCKSEEDRRCTALVQNLMNMPKIPLMKIKKDGASVVPDAQKAKPRVIQQIVETLNTIWIEYQEQIKGKPNNESAVSKFRQLHNIVQNGDLASFDQPTLGQVLTYLQDLLKLDIDSSIEDTIKQISVVIRDRPADDKKKERVEIEKVVTPLVVSSEIISRIDKAIYIPFDAYQTADASGDIEYSRYSSAFPGGSISDSVAHRLTMSRATADRPQHQSRFGPAFEPYFDEDPAQQYGGMYMPMPSRSYPPRSQVGNLMAGNPLLAYDAAAVLSQNMVDRLNESGSLYSNGREAVYRAFILTPISYTTLMAFCTNNLPIPFNFLLVRPYIMHEMGYTVLMRSGGEAGFTFMTNPDFRMSADIKVKKCDAHFTIWFKAIVMNEEMVYVIPNTNYVNYLGGNNTRFFYDNQDVDNRTTKPADTQPPSMFSFLISITEYQFDNPMSIVGGWSDVFATGVTFQSIYEKHFHYGTAPFYTWLWGFQTPGYQTLRTYRQTTPMEMYSFIKNNILWMARTLHRKPNGTYDLYQNDNGCMYGTQPGAAHVFRGEHARTLA